MRPQLHAAVVIALLCAQWGCVTPAAVRAFTGVSKDVSSQFPPLVKDIAGSCIRRNLADVPIGTLLDRRDAAAEQCEAFTKLERPLLAANKALTSYLNALHELAADDHPGFDSELQDLTDNLQETGAFQATQVKAVKGLVSFLARAATSGYQRKQLAQDLKTADDDVKVLTETLADIAKREYGRLLTNEQNSLLARYRKAMDGEPSKAAMLYVEQQWAADLERISARRDAAAAYAKILSRIQNGHHALADSAGRFDAKNLSPILKGETASIQSLFQDFRKAF